MEEGVYFSYRFPINEALLPLTLVKAVNMPLADDTVAKFLRQKSKSQLEEEADEALKEQERIAAMDKAERRKYERELKKKA